MATVANKVKFLISDLIKDKRSLIKILSIALILVLALILRIHNSNESDITVEATTDTSEASEISGASESGKIFIDIGGAVIRPGVYEVESGTRLYEVIELAGGLRSDADTDSVNQAAFVEDGAKIIIPAAVFSEAGEESRYSEGAVPVPIQAGSGLININTADKEKLKTLSGVGDVIADRIIEYRSQSRFSTKEDIMKVNGIGNSIYEKIKDEITV